MIMSRLFKNKGRTEESKRKILFRKNISYSVKSKKEHTKLKKLELKIKNILRRRNYCSINWKKLSEIIKHQNRQKIKYKQNLNKLKRNVNLCNNKLKQ